MPAPVCGRPRPSAARARPAAAAIEAVARDVPEVLPGAVPHRPISACPPAPPGGDPESRVRTVA
jgi:hypothetical protein